MYLGQFQCHIGGLLFSIPFSLKNRFSVDSMTHGTTAVHIAKRCALSWWGLSIEYGFSLYTRCWWISEEVNFLMIWYDLMRDHTIIIVPTSSRMKHPLEGSRIRCGFYSRIRRTLAIFLNGGNLPPLFLGNMPHHQGSKSPSPIMMNHTINSLTECTFYLVIEGHYNLNGWLRMFFQVICFYTWFTNTIYLLLTCLNNSDAPYTLHLDTRR